MSYCIFKAEFYLDSLSMSDLLWNVDSHIGEKRKKKKKKVAKVYICINTFSLVGAVVFEFASYWLNNEHRVQNVKCRHIEIGLI